MQRKRRRQTDTAGDKRRQTDAQVQRKRKGERERGMQEQWLVEKRRGLWSEKQGWQERVIRKESSGKRWYLHERSKPVLYVETLSGLMRSLPDQWSVIITVTAAGERLACLSLFLLASACVSVSLLICLACLAWVGAVVASRARSARASWSVLVLMISACVRSRIARRRWMRPQPPLPRLGCWRTHR